MKTIGVVVLNYNSYWETLKCIESFMNADFGDFNITFAVVDNGSTNDSAKILKEKLRYYSNIHVLNLKSNLGFANGNNIGCKLLRSENDCDYYIFSNSDIRVPINIFKWSVDAFEKNHCDILGPDIYVPKTKTHQNPIKRYSSSIMLTYLSILKKKMELFLLNRKIISNRVFCKTTSYSHNSKCSKYFDCPIHGSFIISNNKIFDKYEDFFDNRTFLYMEEYLLYLRCKESGLLSMVSLDNQVLHLQGESTDTSVRDDREKTRNRLTREIDSTVIYINELKRIKHKHAL